MNDIRSSGARCDQSGKAQSIKMLNDIVGQEKVLYTQDNTKLRKLGWSPKISVEIGIKKTLNFFESRNNQRC